MTLNLPLSQRFKNKNHGGASVPRRDLTIRSPTVVPLSRRPPVALFHVSGDGLLRWQETTRAQFLAPVKSISAHMIHELAGRTVT